ncbi:hypothetical protein BWR59_08695 [Pseudomonas sp. Bc-h]|nr:hypothetical protein BWR59_08695 [Pseudomonas sp. Bc-h]
MLFFEEETFALFFSRFTASTPFRIYFMRTLFRMNVQTKSMVEIKSQMPILISSKPIKMYSVRIYFSKLR